MKKNELTKVNGELIYIPIEELYPHPDNPRKDLGDLSELAESIKVKGVLQNLTVVRGHQGNNGEENKEGYTVIIGHRRTQAAKIAGLKELPCVITEMPLQDQIATMLLENIQRNELTVYEQAKGFQMMLDLGDTEETVADKTGFSKTTVRRRIKLLELDEEKFKKSESRGASLQDYIELERIKDNKLKNKVLDSIGTVNFNNELKKAIDEEENREYLDNTEAEVSKFAIKIEKADGYSWKAWYGIWNKKKVDIPDDVGKVQYYYRRDKQDITIYTKREEVPVDEEAERIKAEKEAEEERRLNGLRESSERAFELRKEFADSLTVTNIKNNFAVILAFWMYRQSVCSEYIDEDEVINILGVPTENEDEDSDELPYTYEDVLSSVNSSPWVKFWNMMCLYSEDGQSANYYNLLGKHKENESLSDWYDLLIRLGYELSDEEKALRDGTHELFITEESK